MLKIFVLITSSWIVYGQFNYEFVFWDEEIFSPCEKYPNNFFDHMFDSRALNLRQTEDGELVGNGYITLKTSIEKRFPVFIETFKKTRGTWQPTFYSIKRDDACVALFSRLELWYSYFKDIPDEQRTCPFTKGQKFNFDQKGPQQFSLPNRDAEGEYKVHMEVGTPSDEEFMCLEILLTLYKI